MIDPVTVTVTPVRQRMAFGRRPSARSEPARTGWHLKPSTKANFGVPSETRRRTQGFRLAN